MSEENTTLSDQDIADLESLGLTDEQAASSRTILEIWQAHLAPADEAMTERITPGYANKIVSTWPKLSYQDTGLYHKLFHDRVIELRSVLDEVIEAHREEYPDAFEHVEDDGEYNESAYLEVIYRWQARIQEWEHNWEVTGPISHIEVAVIADVTSFFVGQMGIVQFLDNVGFRFDAELQNHVRQRLTEHLEGLNA